jgi:uncharacterized membrane protein YeaQ/YmgE (transglycosylase-associated protein family)
MTFVDVLIVIAAGMLVGWVAGLVTKKSGFGLLGNLGVGLVGAVVGSAVFPLLGLNAHNALGSFLLSVGGAVLLILVVRRIVCARSAAEAKA